MELPTGELVFGPPKSEASNRVLTIPIPSAILPDVVAHLADHTGAGKTALLFGNSTNVPLRRSNFQDHCYHCGRHSGSPLLRSPAHRQHLGRWPGVTLTGSQ